MRRPRFFSTASLIAAALTLAAWRLYSRRSRGRIPSLEGVEDADVSNAFNQFARMPQMRFLRRYAIRRALTMVQQGEAVDLGCGPGYLVFELAQQAPEFHVTGIDLSDGMLQKAQSCALRSDFLERVAFRKGDAAKIPFADNSLDLVISTLSLHHWSDPVAVLDEIERVLRPGGAYVIFDLRRDMTAPGYLLFWSLTNFIVPAALYRIKEPLGSRDAAYTPGEAAGLADRSSLRGWKISPGPLWLTIEGIKP